MKTTVIKAFGQDEAKFLASENGINVVKNVTASYNKLGLTEVTNEFAEDQLTKNNVNDGEGLMVVLEAGIPDNRERPYEFVNNVVSGSLEKKLMYQIKTVDGQVIAEFDNKVTAVEAAKAVMKTVKQDLVCEKVYKVDDAHRLSFTLKYTPSKNTKVGTYYIISK